MNAIEVKELKTLSGGDGCRLKLRPIQDSDTENIVKWRNSEAVRSQFIFREPFTCEMHRRWLLEKVYKGLVIQYIIEVEDKPVGSVYLRDIDLQNESGEFGIFIGETSLYGQGVGTTTAELFAGYCLELGFHRVYLRVLDTNLHAKRCYERAGFVFEGTARDMVCIDGVRYDVTFMSIIAK